MLAQKQEVNLINNNMRKLIIILIVVIAVICAVLYFYRTLFYVNKDGPKLESLLNIEFPENTFYQVCNWAPQNKNCFTAFIKFESDYNNYHSFVKKNGLVDFKNDSCGYATLLHEGLLNGDSAFFFNDYFSMYPVQPELDTSVVSEIVWWRPKRDIRYNFSAYYSKDENKRISTNKTEYTIGRISTQFDNGFFYILIECKMNTL